MYPRLVFALAVATLSPAARAEALRATKTVRVRATVARFDRDAYHIGPKYTDGWLAKVQKLANVVAQDGTVELTLFARAAPAR